jgi:TonB family protein
MILAVGFAGLLIATPCLGQETTPCPTPGMQLKPIITTHRLPTYPRTAIGRGEQGATTVTVTIGQDGIPSDSTVTRSSGSVALDTEAASIARTYHWEPPLQDCKPASAQVLIITDWHIGRPPKPSFGLVMPETVYPPGAVEASEMGDTYLEIEVANDGSVKDGHVIYSSGYADLDDKALEVMKSTPGIASGKPPGKQIVLARWNVLKQSPHAERVKVYISR